MGRFRDSSSGDEETMIDISPLIDCVFILLIFFIVATTIVDEKGLEVEKPEPGTPRSEEASTIVLKLDESGHVLLEGRNIGMQGVQSEVKRLMETQDTPVVVQAAPAVPAGTLVQVIDEAKLAGAMKVSVAPGRRTN